MSDTHPRFIVAPYAWPDGEVGYLVVDTLGENGSSPEVMCADSDAHCGRIAEALNFHHDLAASPRDPSLHEARIEIDWHPSASVGEADAVKRLLESVCEGAMETLLEWGVVDPTISLSVDGAGVPKDVS